MSVGALPVVQESAEETFESPTPSGDMSEPPITADESPTPPSPATPTARRHVVSEVGEAHVVAPAAAKPGFRMFPWRRGGTPPRGRGHRRRFTLGSDASFAKMEAETVRKMTETETRAADATDGAQGKVR